MGVLLPSDQKNVITVHTRPDGLLSMYSHLHCTHTHTHTHTYAHTHTRTHTHTHTHAHTHTHRIVELYEECGETLSRVSAEDDLRWYSVNYGVDMPYNWPEFEVCKDKNHPKCK